MISLTMFICFNFHFNPNLLGNNAIARIFEHCGLMTDLGLTLFILIYQVKGVLEVNLTQKSVYQQYQ